MKRTTSLIAAAVTLASSAAFAQTPAPTPDWSTTANVSIGSEYIFRGISQTAGKPTLQGGFDLAHSGGFYAGTWGSNISWLEDFGAYNRSSLEWDFYAGYKQNFPGNSDFFYDVGTVYYYYPGSKNPGVTSADSWEMYAALGWKWVSVKFSYSLDDYFGLRPNGQKTDGSYYVDLSAAYPIGETGVSLIGHYGYLDVKHDLPGDLSLSYSDWKLGAAYVIPEGVLKGLEVGAYYSGNDAKSLPYTDLTGYDTSKDRGVVYVKKTF
ncbi:MAG: TorF family putative porin [Betaproteobacteria bacterium]